MSKTAVITGAARGIGYGIAQELTAAGFDLVINDLMEEEEIEEKLSTLRETGRSVWYCQADVSNPIGGERILREIKVEGCGPVHVLVTMPPLPPRNASTFWKRPKKASNGS